MSQENTPHRAVHGHQSYAVVAQPRLDAPGRTAPSYQRTEATSTGSDGADKPSPSTSPLVITGPGNEYRRGHGSDDVGEPAMVIVYILGVIIALLGICVGLAL